ncbi:MAG: hypothetical protein JST23_02115 [Bacteroidetes bacterium]|nr:hypothetical protein [Bacteroidota bacterium]
MLSKTTARACLSCGKTLKGRSDKKFCDDYCRNNYNNQLKSDDTNSVRLINNQLNKNRKVLQGALPEDKETSKITREQLLLKGFSFKYFTHLYNTKTGNTYYYCYDYGYRQLEKDLYLIVRQKED